ncbi:MAG: TetR family transcriptional regulator [Actinophytocola sp.]|nr:TetR family transcriptional regulator [Actinophytocola sp.]
MANTTEMSSGDRLRARRRQRLANEVEIAALRLFAERGVDAVTVDDIAQAANISRRTFFRYFASKDDLLHGNPERQRDIVLEAAGAAPNDVASGALVRRILLALAADFDDHREMLLLRKEIAEKFPNAMRQTHSGHTSLVAAILEVVTTRAESEFSARVHVHAGFGAMQAAVRTWFTGSTSQSLRELTAAALDLIGLTDTG